MTRNPSPAEIGGMDPRQDAPEISQKPNKEHSQASNPRSEGLRESSRGEFDPKNPPSKGGMTLCTTARPG